MRQEIRIAGFGGQGIVTIGRILGTAFTVFEKKNSVNTALRCMNYPWE